MAEASLSTFFRESAILGKAVNLTSRRRGNRNLLGLFRWVPDGLSWLTLDQNRVVEAGDRDN